jgi:predicted RNA-binding Zn ribbon-like protein
VAETESKTANDATTAQRFDLTSGALCLDFVNTLEDRARAETELLQGYGDLLRFAAQAGILGVQDVADLESRSQDRPEEVARAFRRALRLRDAVYRLITCAIGEGEAPSADVEVVNRELARALAELRLEPRAGHCGWSWADSEDPARLLRPILRSAAELLTSDDVRLVRECGSESCTWLFLDRSRNHSRRWCDMKTCGNRAKARRHYQRRRARQ